MIRGLYEAHLPVRNLKVSIPFYESLGLKLYKEEIILLSFGLKKMRVGSAFGKAQNTK